MTACDPSTSQNATARRVVTGGFLGSVVSVGMTIYLFGVFQDALVDAFDTSVAVLSYGPSLFTLASGVLSPLIGRMLATSTRSGLSIRSVMFAGALALGFGLIGLSRAPSLPIAAVVFGGAIAPGAILMGPLLGQALVTNWFDADRGRMLGIVSAGTTVGGMLMPPLAAQLIGMLGWRDSMATLGVLALALMLPAIALLVRDRPARAIVNAGVGSSEPATDTSVSTIALLRDPRLWLVGFAFGFIFSAGLISTLFMVPYATEIGISLEVGAVVAGARAGCAAAGKIAFGSLADRFGVLPVLWVVVASEALLTAVLIATRDPWGFVALFISIGFVGGAPLPLKATMAAQLFGRDNFPAAMGLLQSLAMPFQLVLAPVGGYVYTQTGTYASVFMLTIPCFVLGGLLPVFLRDDVQPPEKTA